MNNNLIFSKGSSQVMWIIVALLVALIVAAISVTVSARVTDNVGNNSDSFITKTFDKLFGFLNFGVGNDDSNIKSNIECEDKNSESCKQATKLQSKIKPWIEKTEEAYQKLNDATSNPVVSDAAAQSSIISKAIQIPTAQLGTPARCNEPFIWWMGLPDIKLPAPIRQEFDFSQFSELKSIEINIVSRRDKLVIGWTSDFLGSRRSDEVEISNKIKLRYQARTTPDMFKEQFLKKFVNIEIDVNTNIPVVGKTQGIARNNGKYALEIKPQLVGNKKFTPSVKVEWCVLGDVLKGEGKLVTQVTDVDARAELLFEIKKSDEVN